MSEDSRQQRRRIVRERLKLGERALAKGLPETPGAPDMIGVAEILRAKLAEIGNERRASEAAGLAHGLAERSLKAFPARIAIACTRGCSYCCYSFVAVLPPEAFRIAALVRAAKPLGLDAAGVRARALPLRGVSPASRVGRKLACPLLVDGMCSVYAVRPLVCRQATSLSLAACIDEYEGGESSDRVEVSTAHLAHASNPHVALLAAMQAVGLPTAAFELGAALDIALGESDAERRWLGGEDVFAALPREVHRERRVDVVAGRIAAELTA